jgi:hypothetical protein
MAVTVNPHAKDAPAPYTVTRAFYWAGTVQPQGAAIQLTKADAAPLLAANKLEPGKSEAAARPTKPAKVAPATSAPTEEVTAP